MDEHYNEQGFWDEDGEDDGGELEGGGYDDAGQYEEQPGGYEEQQPDPELEAAVAFGAEAEQQAAAERRELAEAADALEQRFPELGDLDVQDEVFSMLDRAGIEPGDARALEFVEEYAAARFLDRADDGDRIVATAMRGRFRLGA